MDRLLVADGPCWHLEIIGPAPNARHESTNAATTFALHGEGALLVLDARGVLSPISAAEVATPLFFENSNYDLYFRTEEPAFRLSLPAGKLVHNSEGGTYLHYRLNYFNNVGRSEFQIIGPNGVTSLSFEVFPTKLDYREDYLSIRDEVERVSRWLAHSLARPAFDWADSTGATSRSLQEWWALLSGYSDQLVNAVKAIARNPTTTLERRLRVVDADRARFVPEKAFRRLLRGNAVPGKLRRARAGVHIPGEVTELTRRTTFDTPQNRFVKSQLLHVRRDLIHLIELAKSTHAEQNVDSAETRFSLDVRADAENMLTIYNRLLRTTFLADVPISNLTSPVVGLRDHYQAVARLSYLLRNGLSLNGGPLSLTIKDIARLYEQWCFLRIAILLADRFEIIGQDLFRLNRGRFSFDLASGRTSTCTFREASTGRNIFLTYNLHYANLPTIGQKPDITLAFEGGSTYIYDAKYRLATTPEYLRTYGMPGPELDDINSMHRYRDAIVTPTGSVDARHQRTIREAIVLFPLSNRQDYRGNRFFQSIGQVGIGALPFLPNNLSFVVDHLESVVERERALGKDC